QTYKGAVRSVPSPTNFFAYVDTAVLYSRLDASLRPMLLLAAAFMPAVTNDVDLSKLPAPEVITKHLSPIVSSQRYDHDGYFAESKNLYEKTAAIYQKCANFLALWLF